MPVDIRINSCGEKLAANEKLEVAKLKTKNKKINFRSIYLTPI